MVRDQLLTSTTANTWSLCADLSSDLVLGCFAAIQLMPHVLDQPSVDLQPVTARLCQPVAAMESNFAKKKTMTQRWIARFLLASCSIEILFTEVLMLIRLISLQPVVLKPSI